MKTSSHPVFTVQQYGENRPIDKFRAALFSEDGCTAAEIQESRRHEYFEIIWLKNGTGIHQIDMTDHFYQDSVIFFLAPGQVHKITQHIKSQGYILKFLPAVFRHEQDFIDYIFDTCLLNSDQSCPIIPIPEQMNYVMEELFSRFTEEFNKPQPYTDIILSSYLKILTTQIRRIKDSHLSSNAHRNKPQYDLFREFRIAVERHYKTKHTVQEYAVHLNTQARTLNSLARKYSHKSALELIHDRIILEAKRRLSFDNSSIKELGYELGFEDPAYFTRFFKKNVGATPHYFKTRSIGMLMPA